MDKLLLSVGQCGADDYRIGRVVREALAAGMERAGSAAEAQRMMASKHYDLILVNRVFDADGDSGIEFIASMKAAGEATPMMLVSDYAEAQTEAVAKGALPGFGKSALRQPEVGARLRAVVSGGDKSHKESP